MWAVNPNKIYFCPFVVICCLKNISVLCQNSFLSCLGQGGRKEVPQTWVAQHLEGNCLFTVKSWGHMPPVPP